MAVLSHPSPPEDELFSGDGGVDLLIEDQLLRHDHLLASVPRRAAATRHSVAMATGMGTEATALSSARPHVSPSAPGVLDPTVSAVAELTSTPTLATPMASDPPGEAGLAPSTQASPTTVAHTATQPSPTPAAPPVAPGDTFLGTTHLALVPPTTVRTDSLEKEALTAGPGTALASPTPNPEEADDIRNVIGESSPPSPGQLRLTAGPGNRLEPGGLAPSLGRASTFVTPLTATGFGTRG